MRFCQGHGMRGRRGHGRGYGVPGMPARRGVKNHNFRHGMIDTPTYCSWEAMNKRCRDPKSRWYGGKGIKVCERWRSDNPEGFVNFLADMGERPQRTTLGRFGDEGNYEPGNCKWMTPEEQIANRRPRKKAA
jgi:hypothetical protein